MSQVVNLTLGGAPIRGEIDARGRRTLNAEDLNKWIEAGWTLPSWQEEKAVRDFMRGERCSNSTGQ